METEKEDDKPNLPPKETAGFPFMVVGVVLIGIMASFSLCGVVLRRQEAEYQRRLANRTIKICPEGESTMHVGSGNNSSAHVTNGTSTTSKPKKYMNINMPAAEQDPVPDISTQKHERLQRLLKMMSFF